MSIVNYLVVAFLLSWCRLLAVLDLDYIHRLMVRVVRLRDHRGLLNKHLLLHLHSPTLVILTIDILVINILILLFINYHVVTSYRLLHLWFCLSESHGLGFIVPDIIWLSNCILYFFEVTELVVLLFHLFQLLLILRGPHLVPKSIGLVHDIHLSL